jgi:RHS repeat-associated protein
MRAKYLISRIASWRTISCVQRSQSCERPRKSTPNRIATRNPNSSPDRDETFASPPKPIFATRPLNRTLRHTLGLILLSVTATAQTQVTLSTAVTPTSGQPGITSITLTGSNFPAGTIQPASVNVNLQPAGGGATATTPATTVTTVVGTTRRVAFIIPATITVATPTPYLVSVSGATTIGTAFVSNQVPLTVNPGPSITAITPNSAQLGQTVQVTITAALTNFVQGATLASFGAGVSVAGGADGQPGIVTVINATTATVQVKPDTTATTGPRDVVVQTGTQTATASGAFTVNPVTTAPPTITSFSPLSVSIGSLVTVTGTNLAPLAGTSAQVNIAKQGGGTISAPVGTVSATSLTFTVPAGATTGPFSILVNSGTATSAQAVTVTPSTNFTLSAAPGLANLIQGQSVTIAASLASSTGFNQLAALTATGVPSGVTAAFNPMSITAGQTAILTLTAPTNQPIGLSNLTVTASATVQGFPVSQSATAQLSVQAPTTSFLGKTVVSDSSETPLTGVTVSMLGLDGNGNTTGCTGSTVSDGAGNFALLNLSAMCVGPQLVGYNGTTVTSPAGKYAGVNIVYTLVLGQVTASPVLVHLPRIDTVETFFVTQNASTNQSYSFASIPGLSVTVYAGTVFTLQDGTKPNPFPLAAVQVPVDRLPDLKPQVPTMIRAFIVAFQPANATTNEPVAVYFPNTLNTPPGTDMVLMTLDPTHGQMVPYGTGSVSSNGMQIVPDADPAHPGHLYGLIHFDWHGPMPPPPPMTNPAPPGNGPGPCSSDGNPGGGSGPGDCTSPTPPSPVPPPVPTQGDCNSCPCNGSNEIRELPSFDAPASVGNQKALPVLAQFEQRETDSVSEPGAQAGDPIDLYSGIQVLTNTDIAFSGSHGSIALIRTYRSLSGNPGPFGIGTGHNYSLQLDVSALIRSGQGIINLAMPDGNQYSFSLTGSGTFLNTTIPAFAGAVMSNPSSGVYTLRYRNGATYTFQTSALGGLEAFLTAISDSNGNTITISLNPSQPLQVTQVTDPVGRRLTFNYDGFSRITSITDPIGRSVSYTYNAQGSLATSTDPAGGVSRYTYDGNHNLLSYTDPRGIVQAQNTLDANGRVIQQLRPDGGVLNFSYTLLNPLAATSQVVQAQVTDGLAVQATYRFNTQGYVTDVTSTAGQTSHIERAPGTNLTSFVRLASNTTTYTYDGNGNVLSSTDPTGLTTQYTYEPVFNKLTSITDPLGNASHFIYDGKGNLLASTDANGNTSSYQYDPTGLLIQATDALNQKTTLTHDGFGNLATVTDPLGNTTSYTYDAISHLVTTTDAARRRTSFTYDTMGRLLTRTDALAGITKFAYDPDGNLLTLIDARNNATTFTYDVMNRLASRTNALGKADTRTYDTDGNLVKVVDRRGITSTFAYDNLNRLVTESYPDATVTRMYDFYGRLVQVNDSASGTFLSSYDLANRLLGSTTPFGSIIYTYDGRGMMASRQVAGQPVLTYSYDPAGNLTNAAMPQASAAFTYNVHNQLVSTGRLNGVSTAYTYDADARLLALTHAKGSTVIDAEGYTYDLVGNRNSHSTSIGQSLITQPNTNQFNVANQLVQFGSIPDSYDSNGNLLQDGNTTVYTWDARNRLKSIVTSVGQTTGFTYDYAGNMIQQADSGTSLNLTKFFVLDNSTNVAIQSASDGMTYSVLTGRSVDSHLAVAQSNGEVQYGLTDAINSTIASVDQNGVITSIFFYEPYGRTTTAGAYPFQFTGRVLVNSTEFYYRARYYNSLQSRFISEDPLFPTSARSGYAYGSNQPASSTDPFGLLALGPTAPTVGGATPIGFPIAIPNPLHDPCQDPEHGKDCHPDSPPGPPAIKCTLKPECTFSGGTCRYSCPGQGEVTRWSSPEACPATIEVPVVAPIR